MAAEPGPMTNDALFAATRREASGGYSAALFTIKGDVRAIPLPERGHDIAVRPGGREVVVFARRPGRFAIAFTANKKLRPVEFFAAGNRHFYGHGVFSPDGRLLYTTENDYENGVGVIGVRDVGAGYRQIGEFPSHGVGPHDMALLDDGETMVIANGGIETTPETGRQMLNLAEMEPSLVYVNRHHGELVEKQILPQALHQLSIRHLAVAGRNRVVFGCQFKGDKFERPALMGFHDRGGEVRLSSAPEAVQDAMKNYVGSVAVDAAGEVIAASAPRGNMITFWRARDGAYLGRRDMQDGCGVAGARRRGGFLLTSGVGLLAVGRPLARPGALPVETTNFQWDNHAERVR